MAEKTVADYIAQLEDWQAEIVSQVRQIILEAAPGADESVKWAQPVYEINGPFAYIKAFKNSVNFGFWRGVDISDPGGCCRAAARKCAISSSPPWMISTHQSSPIMFSKPSNSILPKADHHSNYSWLQHILLNNHCKLGDINSRSFATML